MNMHLPRVKTTLLTAMASLVMLMLHAPSPVKAEGTYDGLYDRPTHYPQFKPSTKWASTMSYFVCARIGGARLHNYEVAVYDQNGDMRATGRSISGQQELCTLTIPGDVDDVFHFEVVYGDFDNPTIVEAEETCEFEANEYQGNIDYPFWLTLPATSAISTPQEAADGNAPIYNIYGMRVAKADKPGIYISNGRKFAVN